MDKIERIIKKSLVEQGTFAKAIKMAKGPTQGTTPSDPMAHLAAAAGKSVPALSTFSKEVQKAKGAEKYANPAYDSKSAGLKPYDIVGPGGGSDLATMNKQLGIQDGMLPRWKNQSAYNELMRLGGRPFIAIKSTNVDYRPLSDIGVKDFVKNSGDTKFKNIARGVQVAMYNHPDRQVGMMVYFYENPNRMYFDVGIYGTNKYTDWSYEKTPGGEARIFLLRGGVKEGWVTQRGTTFNGEVIFIKSSDPMLNNILKSDYIQDLRNYTGIESLFKHNKQSPTVISIFGRDINLTALADKIQSGFDWIGIAFPPIDVINAAWYIGRGRYFEAFLSIIAIIPGVGDAIALMFRPFVKLFNSAARGSNAIWNTMLETAERKGISPTTIKELMPNCIKFIKTARSTRIISTKQADDMIAWINESAGFIGEFLQKSKAAKKLAKSPGLQRKLAVRLGYEYVDNSAKAILARTTRFFQGLWRRMKGATSISGIVKGFKQAGRAAWENVTGIATNYWKSAYTQAYKEFYKVLLKDPNKLAICIYSFVDNTLRKRFIDSVVTAFMETLPQNAAGKYIMREVNSRGIQIPRQFNHVKTEQELREWVTNNFPKALQQLAYIPKSKAQYETIVTVVRAAAAKPGKIVNSYWTVFWTDPLRRFVTEYGGGRITSKFTGGILPTARNFASDSWDNFRQTLNAKDFLKRIDIIYNEFQEFYERRDYGTEKDIDPKTGKPFIDPSTGKERLSGSELNQQSVIFAVVDEAWKKATGSYIAESIRIANKAIIDYSATYALQQKMNSKNVVPGDLDSLNFQSVVSDLPGAASYKLAYWKKLVDAGKVKYLGGDTRTWAVLQDDPEYGITDEGLKKGELYQIDKNGVLTLVGSLQ
jgi:hypothetical protein